MNHDRASTQDSITSDVTRIRAQLREIAPSLPRARATNWQLAVADGKLVAKPLPGAQSYCVPCALLPGNATDLADVLDVPGSLDLGDDADNNFASIGKWHRVAKGSLRSD